MFAFNVHPAYVTLGDGIQVAWGYLAATWRKWLVLVVIVGVADLVLGLMTSSIVPADSSTWFTEDPITGRLVATAEFNAALGRIFAAGAVEWLITLVAGWFVAGIAIAGLRGRPLEFGWILGRGVIACLNAILVGLAVVGVMILWFVSMAISAVFPPLLIVTIPGGVVFLVWVVVRLIFSTLAVFDGHGPLEALSESWSLSSRSVMRLLGWGIVALLMAVGFGILAGILTAVFSTGTVASVASGLTSAVSQVGACFTTFMLAVLYESQRLRRDIMAGVEPMPAGPYGAGGPAAGPSPGGIPGWNTGGPAYPGTAYPPAGGYPGWVNPQGQYPGAYPPAQYPPNTYPHAQFPTERQQGWGRPGYPAADPEAAWQGYQPYPTAPDPQPLADPQALADQAAMPGPPAPADPVPPVTWKWPEPPGATGDGTTQGDRGTTNR